MATEALLKSRRYFSRATVWPKLPEEIRPEQWLGNFSDTDRPLAEALLSSFTYYSTRAVRQLLLSAATTISAELPTDGSTDGRRRAWREYLDSVVITYPTGEVENPSDSGHTFVRTVRDAFDIPEANILSPQHAVERMVASDSPLNLLLVDDFAGSGAQLVETWERPYDISGGGNESLATAFSAHGGRADYVTALATWKAERRISGCRVAPTVRAGNVLSAESSLCCDDTVLVPPAIRDDVRGLVERNFARCDFNVKSYVGAYGFNDLGLSVAFEHGVPDATLPIFWANSRRGDIKWTRLYKRGG